MEDPQVDQAELVTWARHEAARLKAIARGTTVGSVTDIAPAVDFLRRYAPGSRFYEDAAEAANRWDIYDTLTGVANLLDLWGDFVISGLDSQRPFVRQARDEAATDLMEQVRVLIEDPGVHPAASAMLAGAALEEALRGLVEQHSAPVKGRPGLQSYAEALKAAEVIDRQTVKDVVSVAGVRNDAAHGDFEAVTVGRVEVMEQQVNLMLRQFGSD